MEPGRMGCRRDRLREGWDTGWHGGGRGWRRDRAGSGMQERRDTKGMRAGRDAGAVGVRVPGTRDGTQEGRRWDAGETGHSRTGHSRGRPDCPPRLHPAQGSDGARGPQAAVGTSWEPGAGAHGAGAASGAPCQPSRGLPSCRSCTRTVPWSCGSRPAGSPCSPAAPTPCTGLSSAPLRPSWCCPTPPASPLFC